MARDLTAETLQVHLAAGDDASGLAMMIGDLLRENFRDFPSRRRVAGRTNGDVALVTSDRDIAVTLTFDDDSVVIAEGRRDGVPALAGPWLEMARVCSGQVSPARAVAGGKLHVEFGHHPVLVAATGFMLSVPPSFYGDTSRRRNVIIGASVAAAAAAGVAFYVRWRGST